MQGVPASMLAVTAVKAAVPASVLATAAFPPMASAAGKTCQPLRVDEAVAGC